MTSKVARFLREVVPATPCLVMDIDRVENNYSTIQGAFPGASIYYAVKANPALDILSRLSSAGSCFDAASLEEVEMCLRVGANPGRISYGNTVKKERAIKAAFDHGVRMFAFDSEEELLKISRAAPGSKVYCRILVGNDGAEWPLSKKFGCDVEMGKRLMFLAATLGLDPFGLSFHVGSQQTDISAYRRAIRVVAPIFSELKEAGIVLRMLNIGGGYPVRYRCDVPAISEIAAVVESSLSESFQDRVPELVLEPGRFIVADAGVVASEVILVSRKSIGDDVRWVYLDIGRFGGLAETEGEAIKYDFSTPRDGAHCGPVIIAGPTCDSTDTMYEKTSYLFPDDLAPGDIVNIFPAGAYVSTYASQGFNGFSPLKEYSI
jgi:ornithine decarboxylase